jgi:hypothetical protein
MTYLCSNRECPLSANCRTYYDNRKVEPPITVRHYQIIGSSCDRFYPIMVDDDAQSRREEAYEEKRNYFNDNKPS